jgi:endoglucanase
VVNGPNDPGQFASEQPSGASGAAAGSAGGLGDYQDGMVHCPPSGADPYAAFNGHGSRFVDDVRAWQTDEPALDMTGAAILGAALQAGLDR